MGIKFARVDASSLTAFNTTADFILTWEPKTLMLVNVHSSESLDVSLDGTTVHARLVPNTPSAGIVLTQRKQRVWVKRTSASGSPTGVYLDITAES